MTTKATPRPWFIDQGKHSLTGASAFKNGRLSSYRVPAKIFNVGISKQLTKEENDANAELIVRAVNCHDELCHRITMLQAILNDSLLPDDCRKYLATDYDYVNDRTEDLLKRARGDNHG